MIGSKKILWILIYPLKLLASMAALTVAGVLIASFLAISFEALRILFF